jgi:hypothetical protein
MWNPPAAQYKPAGVGSINMSYQRLGREQSAQRRFHTQAWRDRDPTKLEIAVLGELCEIASVDPLPQSR